MISEATTGKHILLAEDDKDQAFLFKIILKQLNPALRLSVVKNGLELVTSIHENKPDIIFLDLNMPCMGGIECLQKIKSDPLFCQIPVVVYSSSTHMNDIHRSYACQADLYMVKPFNGSYLKKALELILEIKWNHKIQSKYYFMNNRFVLYTA